MRAPPGIRTVAGDIGLVVLEVHGSSDEAEVGAPVEHVQVDGRAGFDDGRHRVQDLCREGRLMAERSQALSPWEAPHLWDPQTGQPLSWWPDGNHGLDLSQPWLWKGEIMQVGGDGKDGVHLAWEAGFGGWGGTFSAWVPENQWWWRERGPEWRA